MKIFRSTVNWDVAWSDTPPAQRIMLHKIVTSIIKRKTE